MTRKSESAVSQTVLTLRLSSLATGDLDWIFKDGIVRFGERQAETCQLEIFSVMESLAASPMMGTALEASIVGLRAFPQPKPCRILYLVSGDDLLVARIIHGRQDLERALDAL